MRQKININQIVLVLTVVMAAFIIWKKLQPELTLTSHVQTGWIQHKSDSPQALTQEVQSENNLNSSNQAKLEEKARDGLCGVSKNSNAHLISFSVVRHLNTRKTRYFALPAIHSSCLPENGTINFKIVSYDLETDRAFDYWGDFTMTLQLLKKVSSLEALAHQPEFMKGHFGFREPKDTLRSLVRIGGTSLGTYYLYEILNNPTTSLRQPIGSYTFYPGVSVLSLQDFEKIRQTGKMVLMDLRFQNQSVQSIKGAVKLPIFSFYKDQSVVEPTRSFFIYQNKKEEMPKLPFEYPLILMGANASDKVPYNAVQVFYHAGYKNLGILKDGYETFSGLTSLTPFYFQSLRNENISQLADTVNKSLILDTRYKIDSDSLVLRNSWRAPVRLNKDLNYSKPENRKAVQLSHLNFLEIHKMAKGRKVILIGEDDFDWAPIILFEKLQEARVENISWFREGYRSFEISQKLGILDPKLHRSLTRNTSIQMKKVKVPKVADIRDPQANADAKKFTEIVIVERKAKKSKSFVIPRRSSKKERASIKAH